MPPTDSSGAAGKTPPARSPFAHRATHTASASDIPPASATPPLATATAPSAPARRRAIPSALIPVTVVALVAAGVVAVSWSGNDKPAANATANAAPEPAPTVTPMAGLRPAAAQSAALIALARESGFDHAEPAVFARALATLADASNPAVLAHPERAAELHAAVAQSLGKALVAAARRDAENRLAALAFADAREYRADLWSDYDRGCAAAESLARQGDQLGAVQSARANLTKADAVAAGVRAALIKLAADMVAAGNTEAACGFHKKLSRLAPAEAASVDWLMRHGKPAGGALRDALGIPFAYVPPGEFLRGSPPAEAGRDNDETRTRVTLTRGYYLGATEITQAQWDAVMGAGDAAARLAREPSRFRGPELPMVDISWEDAQLFCRKLSARTGSRYRLPSEAEWEYAARAGTDAPYGNGKLFLTVRDAVVDDATVNAPDAPKPVASVGLPNAWNLHDMHGNVWEWCADWYAPYPKNDARDPVGQSLTDARADAATKVARGGSWSDSAAAARCANRWSNAPSVRVNYIGLRVLLEFDPTLE